MRRTETRTDRLPCAQGIFWMLLVLLSGVLLRPSLSLAEPVVIKFATLAPDGTPWMNIMDEMNRDIQEKSAGQVAFRFYAGGVAGDERDVIRKIRINQLHGGAFSGFGLGEILPELRVLELPLLFRTSAEADHVATALFEHFAAGFAQKGFVLLGLNEAGAVYIFSKDPIRTKADMTRSKIWSWQGDPLPQAIFKAYGIVPVPLSLPNVLPSLQSGLIDACYGTPLTTLALQWFTKVKYRTSLSITNVMGALVLSDALWQQLSADQQTLVRETVHKYNAKAVTNMRQYENKALTLLQTTAGIETIPVAEEEVARLQQISEQVRQELVGKLYPQESLERVLALRDAYRQTQPKD
jgi:TRAP-type C4-dicarboxylate transport system substrate-binding protein